MKITKKCFLQSNSTPNLLYDGTGNQSHVFYTIQYMTIGGLTLDNAYGQAHVRLRPTDYLYDLYDLKNDSRFYKSFKTTWLCNYTATIPKWTASDAPTPDLVGKNKFGVGDTAPLFYNEYECYRSKNSIQTLYLETKEQIYQPCFPRISISFRSF